MANELDKKALKEAEKQKKAKQLAGVKAAAAKKPRKSPAKYFRELKSEFKKVTWPTRKQVFKNTVAVLTTIVISSVGIWALDLLFSFLWELMLNNG